MSGQRFEQYVQRAILEPLGMWSSSFEQPLPADLSARLVASFPAPGVPAESFQRQVAPEGALSTTSADMAAFLAFQLGHGPGTVLSASTLASMHAPALPAQSLHGLAAGEQMTLGLNRWEIRGQPVLSHGGDVGAFHSLLALFPSQDIGLFVSSNGSGAPAIDSDQLRSQLVSPFADRYIIAPDVAAPAPLPGSRERAAAVAGSYLNQRRVASTFVSGLYSLLILTVSAHPDGTLGLHDRFSPELTFQEIRPWLWREVGGVTTLAAARDQTGRVMAIAFAGYASAGRVGFLQGHLVPYIALALALLVLVVTLVAWPIGWLRTRRGGGSRDPDRRSRLVRRLAYASAAPVLAGFGLLAASMRFFPPVIHPLARAGQALLLLGILGVVPAAWHLLITLQSNRRVTRILGASALTLALGYVLALAITFPLLWPPRVAVPPPRRRGRARSQRIFVTPATYLAVHRQLAPIQRADRGPPKMRQHQTMYTVLACLLHRVERSGMASDATSEADWPLPASGVGEHQLSSSRPLGELEELRCPSRRASMPGEQVAPRGVVGVCHRLWANYEPFGRSDPPPSDLVI